MPTTLDITERSLLSLKRFCISNGIQARDLVLYVTSACNLRCGHCYLGSDLLDSSFEYSEAFLSEVLRTFAPLDRLTILGGEPLLFRPLASVIRQCSVLAIAEKRLTTNLLVWPESTMNLLRDVGFRLVVSVDGAVPRTHERFRGDGTFMPLMNNLRTAARVFPDIEITSTISRANVMEFPLLVRLLAGLGIGQLNLHSMSLQGNALAIADDALSAVEWVSFRSAIQAMAQDRRPSSLSVRIPWLVASDAEYRDMLRRGEYHPHPQRSFYSEGQRLVFYPDGRVFMSSENFGSDHDLGLLRHDEFVPNSANLSELAIYRDTGKTPSSYREVHRSDAAHPHHLSVSFKKTLHLDPAAFGASSPEDWSAQLTNLRECR